MPVYFISGADDPCMRNERSFHSSVQHMADLGYTDVTSALYSGMRHEVLNEIGKEMVWNDVLEHIRTWSDEKTA
jgi:alpha-beta hydrolase superfamily lysophospholipase